MQKYKKKAMETVLKVLGVIALFVIISALSALPVMWLWNWLMPEIFGLIKISFMQSWGLVLLTGMLFRMDTNQKK